MSAVRKHVTIYVPTVNDRLKDFDQLFSLGAQTDGDNLNVTVDFSQCWFLRQNAVAFLGGLIRLIQSRGGEVCFLWKFANGRVLDNLAQNGFAQQFGYEKAPWGGNSIPYREDVLQSKDELIAYLKESWLGRGWVHISERLSNEIAGTVWEIYANAFQHGKSPVGVISCGQHYPRWRELHLTIVDFGVGIPTNVREYLKNVNMSADETIKWAMVEGHTTKPRQKDPGGVGLGLLKEFVRVNNGYLEIFSRDGYVYIDNTKEDYQVRDSSFMGTLVNIKLRCDEKYYMLSSEIKNNNKPLF